VRPRRICNWVVVQASESSELLVAKDKRGAVLDNLPCFSHMADHQPRTLQAVFSRSLSLPLWTHAPCGCVGARENRAASWIDERGPLPRN
jgi:hypothetical protein